MSKGVTGGHGDLVIHGLLVEVVFSVAGPDPLEVADVACELLDGFHLLVQVVTLDEVAHLRKRGKEGKSRKSVNKTLSVALLWLPKLSGRKCMLSLQP